MRTPTKRTLSFVAQKVNIDFLQMEDYALEHAKRNSAGLRYGEVEVVLASIHWIPHYERKAFRAKLRHMRNTGIPEGLDEPGKGRVLRFTKEQVLEMLISLDLQAAGWAPYDTQQIVSKIVKDWKAVGAEDEDVDHYAVLSLSISSNALAPKYAVNICKGFERASALVSQSSTRLHTVINISASARSLDEALGKALWS